MTGLSSRRGFLTTGLAAPLAGSTKLAYSQLGKTGLKVTRLGFGCMLASDPIVIERAFDAGINYFDTARAYQNGNNERMVGAALKGRRQKVTLVTKTLGRNKADAERDLEASLRELGTDHLDVWFLHSINAPKDLTDDLLEVQRAAKKAGKIRFAGVTFHFNMPEMLKHVVERGQTDVVLAAYNFTMEPNVSEAIRAARKAGLGIVAMKVMAGGYARIQRGDRLYGQNPTRLTERLKRPGAMLAALKWTLRNESVDSSIIGMTDLDELDENLRAMSEPFRKEDEAVLAAHLERIQPLYCRMCGSCGGVCEKGVHVADTLRFLTYAEGYGQFALARQQFLNLPEAARQEQCRDCSGCSVQCAHGVHVRERLVRAQEMFA